jgi:hypothetical protein
VILTSTDTNVQFKLKHKEKLDTNYEWKICTTFIGKYKINSWDKISLHKSYVCGKTTNQEQFY